MLNGSFEENGSPWVKGYCTLSLCHYLRNFCCQSVIFKDINASLAAVLTTTITYRKCSREHNRSYFST